MNSPWGTVDNVVKYSRGFSFVSTSGHGGFRVSRRLFFKECINAEEVLKLSGIDCGSYIYFEEDCAWALFLVESPQLLIQYSKLSAKDANLVFDDALKVARHWFPKFFESEKEGIQ